MLLIFLSCIPSFSWDVPWGHTSLSSIDPMISIDVSFVLLRAWQAKGTYSKTHQIHSNADIVTYCNYFN